MYSLIVKEGINLSQLNIPRAVFFLQKFILSEFNLSFSRSLSSTERFIRSCYDVYDDD